MKPLDGWDVVLMLAALVYLGWWIWDSTAREAHVLVAAFALLRLHICVGHRSEP